MKSERKYRAVFIDWDDTIGDWTQAEHRALRELHRTYPALRARYATPDDDLAAYRPYNLELWALYGRGEVSKERLHFERFYRPLLGNTPPEEADPALRDLAHEMGDRFLQLTNRYFSLLPDAERVVRLLAERYPLTILSNGFKEVQYYKFAHSGLQDCFRHTIISEEVGVNKPQPEIFRIALQRNGLTADQVVMIGDSYSSDILGAQAAGIDQIWLHDGPTLPTETATCIVPRLADVLEIL